MQPQKVLIVDDNESNRIILSRCVRRAGYEALLAEDGASALDKIAQDFPDLVLLDWNMPDLPGIDLLRAIRASHSPDHLPVVMCTARTASRDVREALAAGANDFITKPIDVQVAIARIELQLQRRKSTLDLETMNGALEAAVATRTRALLDATGGAVNDSERAAALAEIIRLTGWLANSPDAVDAELRSACAVSIAAAARHLIVDAAA